MSDFDERIKNKKSARTVFPSMADVVTDFTKMEQDLKDLKVVFACICLQQEDQTLQVPFDAIAAVPQGTELEISVDRAMGNYVFRAITPVSDPVTSDDAA